MRFFYILIFIIILKTNLFSNTTKNVLILNSYHKGFEFSDTIIKNIEKVFYNNQNINLDILYMDSKQIYTRDYRKRLNDLYTLQLENKNYDLVIPIDQFAYKFVVKNYHNLFEDEKVLFIGVEQYSQELIKVYELKNKVNGIIQKLAIDDNIKIIKKLMPRLKKLYILNDRSENANDSSAYIIKTIQKFKKDIEIEYLRDHTLEELKEYFKIFREDEAILFIRFSNDIEGNYYRTNEVAAAIKGFSLPTFATDNLFLDKGIVGGKLISMDKLGVIAGYFAVDLLKRDRKEPIIKSYSSYSNIFDYNELQRFNISVPRGLSRVAMINTPESFFDRYNDLINSVFLTTPLLLIIIFGLIEALNSKRKATSELKQRLEFDHVLLNAIDSPIFWQDKYGVVLDLNKKFCQLIDLEYDNLIGKNLNSFKENSSKVKKVLEYLDKELEEDAVFTMRDNSGKKRIYYIKQASFESQKHEDGIVTIFTDITKEIEIERQREKQTQYIIQQSKMAEIGEVFSSIAHQWKSPLVTITALAQDMFYSNKTEEKEEDSYHIKNIMLQANYMTNTINDFQDFIVPSKEKTIFDAHKTIENLLNIVRHNMKYNYIDIDIKVKKSTNLDIYGYENEFMQAILNIINNAKDALLNNSEKNRKLAISMQNKYNILVLDIIDNGPGITDKIQKKIFQQYFSTKESGHGIGLYMSKLIIQDKLNGRISYKNINPGSHFRIILQNYIKEKK